MQSCASPEILNKRTAYHLRRQKHLQRHGRDKTKREDKLLYGLWIRYHSSMVRYLRAMLEYERAPRYARPDMPSEPTRPDVDEPDQDDLRD